MIEYLRTVFVLQLSQAKLLSVKSVRYINHKQKLIHKQIFSNGGLFL